MGHSVGECKKDNLEFNKGPHEQHVAQVGAGIRVKTYVPVSKGEDAVTVGVNQSRRAMVGQSDQVQVTVSPTALTKNEI